MLNSFWPGLNSVSIGICSPVLSFPKSAFSCSLVLGPMVILYLPALKPSMWYFPELSTKEDTGRLAPESNQSVPKNGFPRNVTTPPTEANAKLSMSDLELFEETGNGIGILSFSLVSQRYFGFNKSPTRRSTISAWLWVRSRRTRFIDHQNRFGAVLPDACVMQVIKERFH